jgi:hypothetical protein
MEAVVQWLIGNVASNVAASLIIAGLVFLWVTAYTTWGAARIWPIHLGTSLLTPHAELPTVVAATSGHTPEGRPMTGAGQLNAVAALTPSLRSAYRRALDHRRILLSDEVGQIQTHATRDLILIGGPSTNRTTADVLAELDLPTGYGLIHSAVGDQILWPRLDELVRDRPGLQSALGLIIQCRTPFNQRQGFVTIIAGVKQSTSGTFGTAGAAIALVEDKQLRRSAVDTLLRRERPWMALVQTHVTSDTKVGQIAEVEVLSLKDLPRS